MWRGTESCFVDAECRKMTSYIIFDELMVMMTSLYTYLDLAGCLL